MVKEHHDNILIDVGSSTVKVYKVVGQAPSTLLQKSINFKADFSPEHGISRKAYGELVAFLLEVIEQNPLATIKLYATALFRKMSRPAQQKLIDALFIDSGLYFNIISHELEGFYLEMALVGKTNLSETILLINIGGGSTELVVVYGLEVIERHFIDIGAGSIGSAYPTINDAKSTVALDEVVSYVKNLLPVLTNQPKLAIYNGGELTYMKLAAYKLDCNNVFTDADHPFVITLEHFKQGNAHAFAQLSIKDLELLMPHDPKWMHGARGCSAIAQAICEQYGITRIVPSDSNMVHGIMRQELRTAVLCGSLRKHLPYILEIKKRLEDQGIKILSPRFTSPKNPGDGFVVFSGEVGLSPLTLERHHLMSIEDADAVIVCDSNGYVGASALIEIGYAQALGKRIIFTEIPSEFMLGTLPSEVRLLEL